MTCLLCPHGIANFSNKLCHVCLHLYSKCRCAVWSPPEWAKVCPKLKYSNKIMACAGDFVFEITSTGRVGKAVGVVIKAFGDGPQVKWLDDPKSKRALNIPFKSVRPAPKPTNPNKSKFFVTVDFGEYAGRVELVKYSKKGVHVKITRLEDKAPASQKKDKPQEPAVAKSKAKPKKQPASQKKDKPQEPAVAKTKAKQKNSAVAKSKAKPKKKPASQKKDKPQEPAVAKTKAKECIQCKEAMPVKNWHTCNTCDKPVHNLCMLSFDKAQHKLCVPCHESGLTPAEWTMDTHLHDPYDEGVKKPFDRFTLEYKKQHDKKQHDLPIPQMVVDSEAYAKYLEYQKIAEEQMALAKEGTSPGSHYEQARAFQIKANNEYMASMGMRQVVSAVAAPTKKKQVQRKRRNAVPTRPRSTRIIQSQSRAKRTASVESLLPICDKHEESDEEPLSSQESSVDEAKAPARVKWFLLPASVRTVKLSQSVYEKDFNAVLKQCDVDPKSISATYYLFIERVLKCYIHRNTDTVTHINRACLISQAIQDVFNTIPDSRPHGGSVTDAQETVLAVCELMLDMPPRIAKVGTQRWLDALCTVPENITVKQMIEIPTNDYQLLRAFVRHQRKKSTHPFDYPAMTSRTALLSSYIHSSTRKVTISPRQTSKNVKLPGFRNAACIWAFDKLRALGISPVHCPAGLTPTSNIHNVASPHHTCHLFPYGTCHLFPYGTCHLFPYGNCHHSFPYDA